jgi:hypothetical protein
MHVLMLQQFRSHNKLIMFAGIAREDQQQMVSETVGDLTFCRRRFPLNSSGY